MFKKTGQKRQCVLISDTLSHSQNKQLQCKLFRSALSCSSGAFQMLMLFLFNFLLFDFTLYAIAGRKNLLGERKVEHRGAVCTPCFMHNAFCEHGLKPAG